MNETQEFLLIFAMGGAFALVGLLMLAEFIYDWWKDRL